MDEQNDQNVVEIEVGLGMQKQKQERMQMQMMRETVDGYKSSQEPSTGWLHTVLSSLVNKVVVGGIRGQVAYCDGVRNGKTKDGFFQRSLFSKTEEPYRKLPEVISPATKPIKCRDGTSVFPWSAPTREEHLKNLREKKFDVVVIGGGCVGNGVALDAATRGLSVAVIERDDFAAGTSGKLTLFLSGSL